MPASSISLPEELERFRGQLLDLSLRNPLLHYRISKRRTLQVEDEIPDEVFKKIVLLEKPMRLLPDPNRDRLPERQEPIADGTQTPQQSSPDEVTDTAPVLQQRSPKRHTDNQLQTNLGTIKFQSIARAMARDAKTSIEETGINYLHLAIGFLRWHENDRGEEDLRMAPLLLIPVTVQATLSPHGGEEYHVSWNQDDVQTNASLRKKLQTNFAISLPDLGEDQIPSQYFATVSSAIASKSQWHIDDQMLLGFFSFHKLSMYMDIDPAHWRETAALRESSLASQLVSGQSNIAGSSLYAPDYDVDDHEVAMKITLPLDADSSQQSAIADIAEGKSLVIEGPPGTGKSQTIANSIANAIERGKRILFVAEKMAALEVVFKRLAQAGLADFCLELHGHAVAPKKVMESLASRLGNATAHGSTEANDPRRLAECKDKLRAYLRAAATPVGPYQEPLYQLFWRIIKLRQEGVPLRRDIATDPDLPREAFDGACEALAAFAAASEHYDQPTKSAWWGYFPHELGPTEAARVLSELARLAEPAKAFTEACSGLRASLDGDDQRVQQFLIGKDHETLDRLAKEAPQRTIVPLAKLASESFRNQIERLEKGIRTQTDAHQRITRELVDSARDLRAIRQSLGESTVKQLVAWNPQMPLEKLREIQSWVDQTRALVELHQQRLGIWSQLGIPNIKRIDDLQRAIQMVHLLQHSVVADQERLRADLFLESTRPLLARIKAQHDSLSQRKETISKVFHLASVPQRDKLVELIRALRGSGGSWLSWLNRDYRRAARELKSFSKFPPRTSFAGRMVALESLESFEKDFNNFVSDASSARLLGDLFRGLDTDWERVKTLFDWIATARKMGLDHATTNTLLQVRTQLLLGTSISHLQLDFQQLCGQLKSDLGSLAGLDPQTAIGMRFEDIDEVTNSLTTVVQQTLAFAEQLADRRQATVGTILALHQSAVAAAAATADLADLPINEDPDLQAAAAFLRESSESFTPVLHWLDRFAALIHDPALIAVLDRGGPRHVAEKLSLYYRMAWEAMERWTEIRKVVVGNAPCHASWLAATKEGVPQIDLMGALESIDRERDRLPAWLAFCRTFERSRRSGVDAFALAAANDEIPASQLADCFRLSMFNQIAERELRHNAIGFHFTAREIEDLRANFQRLDRQSMSAKSIEIERIARARPVPEGNGKGRVSEFTELALIRHEIGKKTRHCKIRDLMLRAGNAVQALKPCFLMSPLSLARYVPHGALEFDLVIMDEASQIKPEDAIGAILRARQLVVVGDPKQLPPTSFFEQNEEEVDDHEATQFDNAESILEVAQRSFQPYRRLRWHYRSQHESLIQFSNRNFYDEDLVVFPSPHGLMAGYGITATYVEGATCVQGENVREAEAVVQRILEHSQLHPEESLGVAAFNRKQAELIDALLDQACDQDPDLARRIATMRGGQDGLFVKNLETIQGDERDVIFISYTYGPDPTSGKTPQRFGPINSDLGWRRLNVMVTRARKRMEVFSSLRPADIHYGPEKSRGVNAYHDFLEFAFSGVMREPGSPSGREPGSPFEEAVARVVQSLGLEPVFQVGVAGFFIDIGVRRREGNRAFMLGIECDGASYHSSKSARDRDRLREEIITSRGWKIHRIWSTQWFLNQQAEEQRLQRVLAAMGD